MVSYTLDDGLVYISLTNGYVTVIDETDLDLVLPYTWYGKISNHLPYAATNTRTGGTLFMHRLLLRTPQHLHTDHINHNTLDNRRSNLRVVTLSENNQNKRPEAPRNSKTGVRNVMVWTARNQVLWYRAEVQRNGQRTTKLFPYTPEGLIEATAWVATQKSWLNSHP